MADDKRIEPSLTGFLVALGALKESALDMKPLRPPTGEVLVGTVNKTAGADVPAKEKRDAP